MGYIKKLKSNELVGGTDKTTVYPVTSTEAVFEEITEGSESNFKSQKFLNNNITGDRINEGTITDYNIATGTITKGKLTPQVQTMLDEGQKKALTPKGNYNSETEYEALDLVFDPVTNSSYISLVTPNVGHPVDENAEGYEEGWWEKTLDGTAVNTAQAAIDAKVGQLETQVGTAITQAETAVDEAKQETLNAYTQAEALAQQITDWSSSEISSIPSYTDQHPLSNRASSAQVGYFECGTSSATQASNQIKAVTAGGYALPTSGGAVKIKMYAANTYTPTTNNPVKLQFNADATTLKELRYNGEAVSPSNTWEKDEVISVYFDGTNYQASNAQGGGGKAEKIKYDNSQSGLASENVQEALDAVEAHINNLPISQIEEIYFAIADSNGEAAFKVDENGIDAKDVGSNLVEAISRIIVEKAYIYETDEDGFYICDVNGNAAVKQDNEKLYFSSDYVTRDEMWDALQNVTRRSFTPEIVNIKIETQTQFDNLDSTICNAINETGSESSQINIFLKNGVYKFNDAITFSILNSSKKEADNVELNICSSIGEKATIVSDGDEYTPDDAIAFTDTHYICNRKTPYVKGEGYVDQNFRKVETTDTGRINAGGINQMDSLFEQVSGTTYRIRLTEELSFLKNKPSSYFANSIVYNSAWFWIFTRTPLYTDDTYLYVDASEKTSNINQDYTFAQQYPTIYITNVIDKMDADCVCNYDGKIYIPRKVTKLYTCKKCKFMELEGIAFSKLSISDIDFCGTSDFTGKINNNDIFGEASDKLFDFVDCKNIHITSCNFVSVGNQSVIGGRSTNSNYSIANPEAEINNGVGLYIKDNKFTSLQGFGIFSFMEKTEITGNEFYDVGLVTHFGACVSVTGKDYYVANNKMVNCSYAGIRIGDGTDGRKATRCVSGIVENNEIYNETKALIEYKRRTLMDGGAIYLFTHHDATTVRFNIIHDYRFKHECRGIFGDDGTYNVNVYGNVIWNIHDKYIDIRRVAWSSSNTQGQPNNVNVKVGHNILFGNYLIGGCNNLTEGNSSGYETNGCEVKKNLLCSIRQTVPYSGTIANITSVEADLKSGYSDFKNGKIFTDADISDFELNEFINNRIFKIQ